MKGSSKVIMGATLSMVVILVFVLCLILVLLAELYCSLLLRREPPKPDPNPTQTQQPLALDQSTPSPLSSFYCQGVLDAPRSFLFPKLPTCPDIENQKHGKLHEFFRVPSPVIQMGIPKSAIDQAEAECENLMYISNPIYDNDVACPTRVESDTPFGTPDSSPSRLGGEEEEGENPDTVSLPMAPMKGLPARSVGNSVISDYNTSHIGKSSSSSSSPHTSHSW